MIHRNFSSKLFAMLAVALFAIATFSLLAEPVLATTTYTYIFQGPFYLSGSIDTEDRVQCNIKWSNNTVSQITLSNNNFTQIISTDFYIKEVTWNSSSALNYTSQLVYPQPTTTSSIPINIYVPNPNQPFFLYTFPVTSFIPLNNGYLSMHINIAGVSSTMAEQVSLDAAGVPTFVMQQFETYTLMITCDEGTYSQQFSAQNIQSNSIAVLSGAFGTNTTATPTFKAERTSATTIGVFYNNPNGTTTSLNILVTHKLGATAITDYNHTVTSNTYNATMNVDSATDYLVTVTAIQNGIPVTYKIPCPSTIIPANPLSGIFDFVGHWQTYFPGIDPAQLFGGFILVACLSIGTKWSTGATVVFAWIIAGALTYAGFLQAGLPFWGFAGFFSIMIIVKEIREQSMDVS